MYPLYSINERPFPAPAPTMTTAADIQGVYVRIIRKTLNSIVAGATANAIDSGQTTMAAYIGSLIAQAVNSTRPALLVSNYVEGVAPASGTLDARTAFCQAQYDAYVAQGSASAFLGPYEALGVAFADTSAFVAKVSGKTLAAIIQEAYQAALGRQPTAAQVTHFTGQYTYFYNLYVNAGIPAATADIRAKGAVVGQVLGYGGSDTATTFSAKATAWLDAAGYGSPAYGVPL